MSDEGSSWLWIIAGPNGSGKTTFARRFVPSIAGGVPFVNVDDIARSIDPDDVDRAARKAGELAIREIEEHINSHQSFAIETTLAGNYQKRLVQRLLSDSWRLGLVYLWIGSADRSIERVSIRVKAGGHDVPADQVRRRFQRGLRNLDWYLRLAHRASIYDNTLEMPQLVATFDGGSETIVNLDIWSEISANWTSR